MMDTITISKTEYEQLTKIASKFHNMRRVFTSDFFAPPPTTDIKYIMKEFKNTGLYNGKFLKSLEQGLKSSNYFHKTTKNKIK